MPVSNAFSGQYHRGWCTQAPTLVQVVPCRAALNAMGHCDWAPPVLCERTLQHLCSGPTHAPGCGAQARTWQSAMPPDGPKRPCWPRKAAYMAGPSSRTYSLCMGPSGKVKQHTWAGPSSRAPLSAWAIVTGQVLPARHVSLCMGACDGTGTAAGSYHPPGASCTCPAGNINCAHQRAPPALCQVWRTLLRARVCRRLMQTHGHQIVLHSPGKLLQRQAHMLQALGRGSTYMAVTLCCTHQASFCSARLTCCRLWGRDLPTSDSTQEQPASSSSIAFKRCRRRCRHRSERHCLADLKAWRRPAPIVRLFIPISPTAHNHSELRSPVSSSSATLRCCRRRCRHRSDRRCAASASSLNLSGVTASRGDWCSPLNAANRQQQLVSEVNRFMKGARLQSALL